MSVSFAFRPRLLDALKGYTRARWFADLGAGVTVGIVALPLAMAFAIASGLKPEAGLWTAIIGGFLIALLGGTNVQIGGPAGAFIVIVYGIVERYGVANLLISTACAGVLLFLLGMFKLGSLVRFVPVSIVIGFTNGIAVLIALSQVKDWLGLSIDKMPGNFFSQVHVLGQHIGTLNPYALGLGGLCLGGLFLWPRLFMHGSPVLRIAEGHTVRSFARVPAPVVALITLTALAYVMDYPVETIGSRFGGIPQQAPAFALPDFSWDTVRLLVTPTVTIALLGAIESLLCARVADQLATNPHHKKHDPNQELMAQGVANFIVPFFGGMPATGTIARTVTNLRAGATSPIAGIVHAATLALIVLLAAPLALHIPLAVLAGILLYVAWNMGEWHEFVRLKHFSNHYRLLMLGTFFLTVVFDLTVAVEVGLGLACVLFVRRMSALFRAEPELPRATTATAPAADQGELAPGACRTWSVESENRTQRGQFSPDLQPHSGAMGQKDGEKWTAAVNLQPTIPKSDRLLGKRGDGQAQHKTGALALRVALAVHGALVAPCDGAHQGQAQAHATGALAGAGQAVEGFEDAFAQLCGHARPLIAHPHFCHAPLQVQADAHGAIAVAAGVFQQVAQRAAQQLGHGMHFQRLVACIQLRAGACAFLCGQPHQIHHLERAHIGLARVQAAGQQDFVHELVELGDVAQDLGPRTGRWRTVQHQFHAHADACQR